MGFGLRLPCNPSTLLDELEIHDVGPVTPTKSKDRKPHFIALRLSGTLSEHDYCGVGLLLWSEQQVI